MKKLIESFLSPDGRLPRWWLPLVLVFIAVMGVIFWKAACGHGDTINKDVYLNDQKVYINMAAAMKDSNYEFFVARMRMPLYGLVQSVFYKTGTTLEDYFPIGRRVNTGLLMVCVGVLALAFRPWLGWGLGVMAALLSGFTFFIMRAGYVQPEGLLVVFIGLSCAMLMEMLRKPVWWKAVIAGLLLCGWHMTKASSPALVGMFFMVWTGKMIWPQDASRKQLLLCAAVLLASYIAPMSGYLWHSYKVFGEPFYNTQSKYYMWCEDVHEKHRIQQMPISAQKATPEEIAVLPTSKSYLARHTTEELRKRVQKGYYFMMKNVWEQHAEMMAVVHLCCYALLLAVGLYPRKAWALAKERPWEIIFALGVMFGFGLLYSWLQPTRVGPRIIASMHLVPVFFSLLWFREIVRGEVWKICGMTLSVERLLVAAFIPLLLLFTWTVTTIAMSFYAGG